MNKNSSNNNNRFLHVGLNGKDGNLEMLMENYGDKIEEVYTPAPPSISPTGRPKERSASYKKLIHQAKVAHKYGVKINVLMNGSCLGTEQFSKKFQNKIKRFLKFLEAIRIDRITITDTVLMHLVKKNTNIEIKASSFCLINNPAKAKRFEEFGVKHIVLPQEVVRDFEILKK